MLTVRPSITYGGIITQIDPDTRRHLDIIACALRQASRVIVLAGAGISTAAGLPDFRSPNGLYANGELFSEMAINTTSSRLRLQESAFFLRHKALSSEPTATHQFIVDLRDDGQLLRTYTQNIDSLEQKAGLNMDSSNGKVDCIQLHGSLSKLRCLKCFRTLPWSRYEGRASEDLPCHHCKRFQASRKMAGKRVTSIGSLVPDIIRIGQLHHPDGEYIAEVVDKDCSASPDMMLILGTSLRSYGANQLAKKFARRVKANGGQVIYVDLSKPRSHMQHLVDYWVRWESDAWVQDYKHWNPNKPGSSVDNPIVLD